MGWQFSRAVTGGCPALAAFPKDGVDYGNTLFGNGSGAARAGGSTQPRHDAGASLMA